MRPEPELVAPELSADLDGTPLVVVSLDSSQPWTSASERGSRPCPPCPPVGGRRRWAYG